VEFPARFRLVAACNPCPCGNYGEESRVCTCTPAGLAGHRARLSGPLLDRIDLQVYVSPLSLAELAAEPGEATAAVRARVEAARARLAGRAGPRLGHPAEVDLARLPAGVSSLLETAVLRTGLSARAVARVLAVARTIAALDAEPLSLRHYAEAITYRALDRRLARTGP
ncbi:MAG TPA: ATP-binding protein, partial [Thermodesulfobacteriota bacterium]